MSEHENLISSARGYYIFLFEKDMLSETKLEEIVGSLNDSELRKEIISYVYDIILTSHLVDQCIVKYIRTGWAMKSVARVCHTGEYTVKNKVAYFNKTIGKELTYEGKNLLYFMIKEQHISNEQWKDIRRLLDSFRVKHRKVLYKGENLFNNKNMLINIPVKESCTTVDEKDFKDFMKLIKPYFITERSKVQKKINQMLNMAGYLNYIMSPDVDLTDDDKRRKKEVEKLLTKEDLEIYKQAEQENKQLNKFIDVTNKINKQIEIKEEPVEVEVEVETTADRLNRVALEIEKEHMDKLLNEVQHLIEGWNKTIDTGLFDRKSIENEIVDAFLKIKNQQEKLAAKSKDVKQAKEILRQTNSELVNTKKAIKAVLERSRL